MRIFVFYMPKSQSFERLTEPRQLFWISDDDTYRTFYSFGLY